MKPWYQIDNTANILSPALLFYPERIQRNIDSMIAVAGNTDRLRPHIKTHKCREIVTMQRKAGIHKFKCATLREAEMLLEMGVKDVLLAYPLSGPSQKAFLQLKERFPDARTAVLVDHEQQVRSWKRLGIKDLSVYIDLNVGMNRTGILPEKALELRKILDSAKLLFRGWHVYDGHIHDKDPKKRKDSCDNAFSPVYQLLAQSGDKDAECICGGSISFSIHALYPERQLSPGTTLLWDQGYTDNFTDLGFEIAACLLGRVVSKPAPKLICIDLGHKAVSAEMKGSPVFFPQIPDAIETGQSEEHIVISSADADRWLPGDVVYAFPWHICPTVALHEEAGIVRNRVCSETWKIVARNRKYHL